MAANTSPDPPPLFALTQKCGNMKASQQAKVMQISRKRTVLSLVITSNLRNTH